MFNRVLIANRGEIAVRIARTCRALGIETVAVYSDADADALHLRGADRALHLGAAAPLESYLNIERIVAAAVESGAQALHPGYGFLAESEHLARACDDAGVVFVGPPAEAIEKLGHKGRARELALSCEVPVLPAIDLERGQEAAARAARLRAAATEVGYPLLIKAAAGGGGKGMRLVTDIAQLKPTLESATREAAAAFGDGTVYVEKCVEQPRHIEFQVLADNHGRVVHLFERECSIQRRHQKLVEETPSTVLTPEIRSRMGEAAVTATRAAGYRGAGTIEFLFDKDTSFYFLEMNTRIQVEHPVTEFTTGVDLVKWQIRIARGEEIPFEQSDLVQRGHAIECRIYAEDAERGFMPSSGTISFLKEPWGPGVRNDSGIYEGYEVSTFYDPILAKLVVYDENRELARRKMLTALENYVILGIRTSISFLRDLLAHEAFLRGETYTDFIDRHMKEWKDKAGETPPDEVVLAAALAEFHRKPSAAGQGKVAAVTPWQTEGSWEIGLGR